MRFPVTQRLARTLCHLLPIGGSHDMQTFLLGLQAHERLANSSSLSPLRLAVTSVYWDVRASVHSGGVARCAWRALQLLQFVLQYTFAAVVLSLVLELRGQSERSPASIPPMIDAVQAQGVHSRDMKFALLAAPTPGCQKPHALLQVCQISHTSSTA